MIVNKIDVNSLYKDIIYHKNIILNDKKEENDIKEEYDFYFNDTYYNNDYYDFNIGSNSNNSEPSLEESYEASEKELQNINKINGLIKAINYLNNYSRMKQDTLNEKYIILFTDMINIEFNDEDRIEHIFNEIIGDKNSIFLLVGKIKHNNLQQENDSCLQLEDCILNKFGEKSEVIELENMKIIKSILSNNNAISDEIFYPNEIYK